MRMAINWACYLAYVTAENKAYEESQGKKKNERLAMHDLFKELEEQANARGS